MEWYSRVFAKKLIGQFPHWKSRIGQHLVYEGYMPVPYLEARIPSPNARVLEPLIIRTYPNEIIISWFGGWHTHFSKMPDEHDCDYMERALDFLYLLVNNEYIVGVHFSDFGAVSAGFTHDADMAIADPYLHPEQGVVRIRSWHGSHDRDLLPSHRS